uniref:J domain-containing protein n=1 Tax=Chaetoceros debilis TaxID=122233 RepID=A0A7S3VBQ1_9STRA|mmetsp:Transcript_21993/g.33430  ORF Transcript_21993/g.33430 Transcript_21993/m.33430 type:complete len:468 (+) Transcript_21993:216-1619(+)
MVITASKHITSASRFSARATLLQATPRANTQSPSAADTPGRILNISRIKETRRFFSIHAKSSPFHFRSLPCFHMQPSRVRKMKMQKHYFSSKADFYTTLNVPKSADKASVKKAYFKLAKEYHPDTNKGDEKASEKFKKVTEAYEVLSDDKQRELYDNYGHAGVDPNSGFNQQGGNPFGGGGNPFGGAGGFNDGSFHFHSSGGGQQIDPEDLFDAFFGGSRRQRGPRRGADLQMHVNLPFMDAVLGVKRDLNVRYQLRDPVSGRVEVKERSVECSIPAGIDSGMNLRLGGQGAEGDPGAPRGDLMVTVIVEEDENDYFQRNGADVHVEIPVSVTQAILGGSVDVKTLTGTAEMKIPQGCQPDTKLMMRGKGIPYLKSSQKGNQIVHLKIEIPQKVTPKQEELLREFDAETDKSGQRISGRLAEAAGSAFDSFFGNNKSPSDERKDSKEDVSKSKEESDDENHKKSQST